MKHSLQIVIRYLSGQLHIQTLGLGHLLVRTRLLALWSLALAPFPRQRGGLLDLLG